MASDGRKEALRKMLRERVPPFSKDRVVRDLCEDVIETFGSLYPDQTFFLCMRIALRLSTDKLQGRALRKSGGKKKGVGRRPKPRRSRRRAG